MTGMTILTDTVSWGLIAGVALPPLIAVAQRPTWTPRARTAVGAGVAVIAGAVTSLANGSIGSGQTTIATVAAVLVASAATYQSLWKNTVAPVIERATSPAAPDTDLPRRGDHAA